jgi:hypothetical protein
MYRDDDDPQMSNALAHLWPLLQDALADMHRILTGVGHTVGRAEVPNQSDELLVIPCTVCGAQGYIDLVEQDGRVCGVVGLYPAGHCTRPIPSALEQWMAHHAN